MEKGSTVALHALTFISDASDFDYVSNNGNLTIDHSTVSNLLQGVYNTGAITLTDSTISGNSGSTYGSIENQGVATINDCTITQNREYGFDNEDTAVITDSTITGNEGGGIRNAPGNSLTLSNTIVANNPANDTASTEASGAIKSLGHNLISRKDGSTGWLSSDLTGSNAHPLDPKLSPLGHYGGLTQTLFTMTGSPALGAGSVALIPAGVTTDQRGFGRTVGGKVDIGAFETQSAAALTFTPPAAQAAIAGTAKTVSLGSVAGSGPFIVTVDWADGTSASLLTVKNPGSLGTISHAFDAVGSLANTIVVVDHLGDLKTGIATVNVSAAALTTITVNTIHDTTDATSSSTVSLRDAINRADARFGPVNIAFDATVFKTAQTIALASAIPDLTGNHFGLIDFIGPSAGVTIKSHTVFVTSGHGQPIPTGNEFLVDSGVAATFSNITFLQLGFTNKGTLNLVNSTITGNTVVGNGGGIYNYYGGKASLTNSTVSGNDAQTYSSPGLSYNGYGGGIENQGTLTIVNSTIAANSADLSQASGIDNQGIATIFDSTISANTGGGINDVPQNGGFTPKTTLGNTIVAGNNPGGGDASGKFISSGHNLIGATDGSTGWVASDLKGTVAHPLNPVLSPLGNNGGPTQTLIPLPGSPALGAGSVSLIPAGVTTDQRGGARTAGGKVDIGSVEIEPNTPFGGSPAAFTTIQAENFDLGGQGSGYYDPGNVNRGGLYRTSEGVGIGAIPAASGGGFFVGYTQVGEFLKYTVSVAATGTYTLNFRVSSTPKGGTFQLNVDGTNVTGALSIPNSGNFNTYQIVSKGGVHMTAGTHVLELLIDSVGSAGVAGNFDWIAAVKTG